MYVQCNVVHAIIVAVENQ